MNQAAAILLCAGKGVRMGASDRSKVAYDCAGIPVIRRIVRNMREGGVSRFVVVVGHMAESVMAALADEPGILYAYQKEQKGTGHAAACGLAVLEDIGFSGRVIISMGDKIVAPRLVRLLLDDAHPNATEGAPSATIGVQANPGGTSRGHVVVREGRVLGIVEAKDIRRARERNTMLTLCGRTFSPDEVAATPYLNAALYAFDVHLLGEALRTLRPDNAQGELYLTDVVEWFAKRGAVSFYTAESQELLTYSTKTELRAMSRRFLRTASAMLADPECPAALAPLLRAFIARYGDRPCIVASAPGRVNLMGRHIEHRGGSTNMMAIEARTSMIVAPREDDRVVVSNLNPAFPDASFGIAEALRGTIAPLEGPAATAAWLDFLDSPESRAELDASRGHWVNYIRGAVLRFRLATDAPLCGMDILASGDIPVAAGLSSSSALVVATAEAVVALNALNVTVREFVDLCGEGEWFVGSRGGAGDHAAMKCSRAGHVVHLLFKPFRIGESAPFPADASVIVIDSGEMAKKSEGARETFNARIRDYETAFNDIRRHFPDLPVTYFRDLAFLPEKDLQRALAVLSGTVRGVALFGVKECRRAERCLDLLKAGDLAALGALMKESHDGDRLGQHEYECSTPRIDALCDRLNALPDVYGSQLVGAGLGGCVVALVRRDRAHDILATLSNDGFSAFICTPANGSCVKY